MRISARKGSKITQNVFELKLTKPRKIILNLVTTNLEDLPMFVNSVLEKAELICREENVAQWKPVSVKI